jgi:hypothetical protein
MSRLDRRLKSWRVGPFLDMRRTFDAGTSSPAPPLSLGAGGSTVSEEPSSYPRPRCGVVRPSHSVATQTRLRQFILRAKPPAGFTSERWPLRSFVFLAGYRARHPGHDRAHSVLGGWRLALSGTSRQPLPAAVMGKTDGPSDYHCCRRDTRRRPRRTDLFRRVS